MKKELIYASAYKNDFSVSYVRVETKEKLKMTYGSKYTSSEIGNTFVNIKMDLEAGKHVLFCGLPCHVAGLKSFLSNSNTSMVSLYCLDLFCHGEASRKVWNIYLRQNALIDKLQSINMRCKASGWRNYNYSFEYKFADHTKIIHNKDEMYFQGYSENLYTKPACFKCHFKEMNSKSDITLGDFWGVDKIYPDMDDNQGTSAVVINTDKGEKIFNDVTINNDKVCIRETSIEKIISFDNSYIRKFSDNPLKHKFLLNCDNSEDINRLIENNVKLTSIKKYLFLIRKAYVAIFKKISSTNDCVGCTTCVNICPKHIINLTYDEEGFLQPTISTEKCVRCKKCIKTCPVTATVLAKQLMQK